MISSCMRRDSIDFRATRTTSRVSALERVYRGTRTRISVDSVRENLQAVHRSGSERGRRETRDVFAFQNDGTVQAIKSNCTTLFAATDAPRIYWQGLL